MVRDGIERCSILQIFRRFARVLIECEIHFDEFVLWKFCILCIDELQILTDGDKTQTLAFVLSSEL